MLEGHSILGVRSTHVLLRRSVRPASELREITGLKDDQALAVVFFAADLHLEEVWGRRLEIATALTTAGYAFAVAPSFSIYEPRSRFEQLYNLFRSMRFFELLQAHHVPAIPRIGWIILHDIRRAAQWLNENQEVRVVALDVMTVKAPRAWDLHLQGVKYFDSLTGHRLHYVINGPGTHSRRRTMAAVVPLERLTYTRATLAAPVSAVERTTEDPYGWQARVRIDEALDAA